MGLSDESSQIKNERYTDLNQSRRNSSHDSSNTDTGSSTEGSGDSSEGNLEAIKEFSKKDIEELLYQDDSLFHRV